MPTFKSISLQDENHLINTSCKCCNFCCKLLCCSRYPASIVSAIKGKEMLRIERCSLNCSNCFSALTWLIWRLWYKKYAVQHVYSEKGSQLVCIVYSRNSHATVFETFDLNGKKIYAVKCPKDENKARKLKLEILSVE